LLKSATLQSKSAFEPMTNFNWSLSSNFSMLVYRFLSDSFDDVPYFAR
jgi:hypothetical protein